MEPIIFLKMFNVLLLTCCQLGIFLLNPFNQTILTFTSTMFQIFVYSVCGELVAAKAFEVSMKLYGSQWYNMQDEGLKKALIVVLNRSQQACYFSIGSYAPLSIGTFTTVSYSLESWKSLSLIESISDREHDLQGVQLHEECILST